MASPPAEVVGIVTRRDMMFLEDNDRPLREVMSTALVTAGPETTLQTAQAILNKNKVEKLLLVDDAGRLTGLITMRDIAKQDQFPLGLVVMSEDDCVWAQRWVCISSSASRR